ncbi:MAG: hypothetical protein ABWX87_01710, partial [Pseudoxanthomonas sp.]
MATTTPFTDAHAIARVEVGIAFQRSLSDDELRDLRVFAEGTLVNSDNYAQVDQQGGIVVFTAAPGEDGAETDEMFIGQNVLGFRFHEYRGWSHLVSTVGRRFGELTSFLEKLGLIVRSVGLEVQDQFFS